MQKRTSGNADTFSIFLHTKVMVITTFTQGTTGESSNDVVPYKTGTTASHKWPARGHWLFPYLITTASWYLLTGMIVTTNAVLWPPARWLLFLFLPPWFDYSLDFEIVTQDFQSSVTQVCFFSPLITPFMLLIYVFSLMFCRLTA